MYREERNGRQWRFFVGCILLATSFVAGYGFRAVSSEDPSAIAAKSAITESNEAKTVEAETDLDFDLFWQVWQNVKTSYVDQPVTDEQLFYGAIHGLAGAVDDPYTEFFDPQETKEFNETLDGEFQGIGAEIGIKQEQLVIIAPLAGSPAEAAGLLPNDAILKINGEDTVDMSLEEAVSKIRGEANSQVTLNIFRAGDTEPRDVTITRQVINIPNLTYSIQEREGKKIAVIELSRFNKGTADEFAEAAQQALLDGADGVILDVRNNPGGLLEDSIEVASHFVDEGTIVREVFSDGKEEVHNTKAYGTLANIPTVVLQNGGSASASEIVAGALQDAGKATVVGEKSFGKGSVQDYRPFADGSSIKITVAKWLTPNGTSIAKEGITPTIEVDITREDVEANRDPQLDKAFSTLLEQLNK